MPRMILTIGCALLQAGACSDDDTPPAGDSAADLSAADHTAQPDVAAKDTTPGADAAADAAADTMSTPDAVDPACNNVQCNLKNDCCDCAAWPKAAKAPACPQRNCLISSCTSHKLGNVKARCVGGVCRLGL